MVSSEAMSIQSNEASLRFSISVDRAENLKDLFNSMNVIDPYVWYNFHDFGYYTTDKKRSTVSPTFNDTQMYFIKANDESFAHYVQSENLAFVVFDHQQKDNHSHYLGLGIIQLSKYINLDRMKKGKPLNESIQVPLTHPENEDGSGVDKPVGTLYITLKGEYT
mmetsp:Transcript_446/g.817  ORF Transcript_446/g.817 Transcript_446/m.817 type:complete len:164 (+) Transcript_446:1-492(+)